MIKKRSRPQPHIRQKSIDIDEQLAEEEFQEGDEKLEYVISRPFCDETLYLPASRIAWQTSSSCGSSDGPGRV